MIRGAAVFAIGVAVGAIFRDAIQKAVSDFAKPKNPETPSSFRSFGDVVRKSQFASAEFKGAEIFDNAMAQEQQSFATVAECFDYLLTAHEDLRRPIMAYRNAHPNDPDASKLISWWQGLGAEIAALVIDEILSHPEVQAAFQAVQINTKNLNTVTQEMKTATATYNKLALGLGFMSAVVAVFKKSEEKK